MRKSTLIGFLVSIAMLVLTVSQPVDAQLLKVSIGISQTNTIWQTFPHAFAEVTRWGGVSLAALFERITISTGITIVDFESMRFAFPPTFYGEVAITLAHLEYATAFIKAGAVITPSVNWVAWYLGIGLTSSLMRYIDVAGSFGIEITKGAAYYSPGMCIWMNFGIYWSWIL